MAIFFETEPFDPRKIKDYHDSALVSLKSDGTLVVKSGILPRLGYALWAFPRPKQANDHTKQVIKKIGAVPDNTIK
ncbi:MAG: hypothetical protein ACOYK6_06400 [Chthoniobacterales bacterium]